MFMHRLYLTIELVKLNFKDTYKKLALELKKVNTYHLILEWIKKDLEKYKT